MPLIGTKVLCNRISIPETGLKCSRLPGKTKNKCKSKSPEKIHYTKSQITSTNNFKHRISGPQGVT